MTNPTTTRTVDDIIDALQIASSQVSGSVAVIHAMVQMEDGRESSNIGTAYCVDKRGYFLTALHVVGEKSQSFIVGDALFETCLVAIDARNDLALMKVVNPTGEFTPVTFAAEAPEDGEIVAGLGYPENGLLVELASFLGRFCGRVVDGVGPNGLTLDGDTLQTALCFVGAQSPLGGYSGGPLVNENGQVVASTMKADDELGFVIGPSAADLLAFVAKHLPVA